MEKKLTAIKVHFKNRTARKFSVNGNTTFRAKNEFQHIDEDGKTIVSIATSEIDFIEYFYSEVESKQ